MSPIKPPSEAKASKLLAMYEVFYKYANSYCLNIVQTVLSIKSENELNIINPV